MLPETIGDAASAVPVSRLPEHPPPAIQHCPLTAPLLLKRDLYGTHRQSQPKTPSLYPFIAVASLGVHPILYGGRALQASGYQYPASSPQAEDKTGGFDPCPAAICH